MYCFANAEYDYRYYRTRISHKLYSSAILWLISRYEGWMIKAIKIVNLRRCNLSRQQGRKLRALLNMGLKWGGLAFISRDE